MVKIVFFSDTHLGIDMPIKPKKERRRRGPDYFKNFEYVLNYAIENKADLLIHGGDLFDKPTVHQSIVDLAYEQLFTTAEKGIPIVICPGNHERSVLPPSLYINHPNIFVFKKPEVFSFTFSKQSIEIAGFPFVRKNIRDGFVEIARNLKKQFIAEKSTKLLLMHQAIEGAIVGPQQFMFRHGQDVVQVKDIPDNYHLILSGHIHPTQVLKTNKGVPIIYPGSTERTAFAEKDETKGFYEIRIDNDSRITYKFISMKTRPMEIIHLNAKIYSEESLTKDIKKQLAPFNPHAVVQIRFQNPDFVKLLSVKLLDAIFPETMNYQISGYNTSFYNKSQRKNRPD